MKKILLEFLAGKNGQVAVGDPELEFLGKTYGLKFWVKK
jgi:hypothetical protein